MNLHHCLHRTGILIVLVLLIPGCMTFEKQTLPQEATLGHDLTAFSDLPVSDDRVFDSGDGLDLVEVGFIAAINNPTLKSERARLEIARAQVFSAGLWPDLVVDASVDKPHGDTAGLVSGTTVGLSYELGALLTRGARVAAEDRTREQAHLDVLWQEWQGVQRARTLAVHARIEAQQTELLQHLKEALNARYERSAEALATHDVSVEVNAADLVALVDLQGQLTRLVQAHNDTLHELNLVLGLAPNVEIAITPMGEPEPIDAAAVKDRLVCLPAIRPDLMALRAGFDAQQARLRGAILARFPALGVTVNRARDTSDVRTGGLGISLILPFLNGNRGDVAIQRATRAQLRQEFAARLAQSDSDVDRLMELQSILRSEADSLARYLPELKAVLDRTSAAYDRGDVPPSTFLAVQSTWVAQRLEQLRVEQVGWDNHIALETLLALPGVYPERLEQPTVESTDSSP